MKQLYKDMSTFYIVVLNEEEFFLSEDDPSQPELPLKILKQLLERNLHPKNLASVKLAKQSSSQL